VSSKASFLLSRLYSVLPVVSLGLVVALVGCARDRGVHQFEPMPVARISSQSLGPVSPRSVTDLLRDAQNAFEAANSAQEKGDREAALNHYTEMLELLCEANLDPSVFYNLRSEFKRILDDSTQQAKLYEEGHAPEWREGIRISDLVIQFPLSNRVLEEIDEIQNAYPKNFQAGLDRSHRYRNFIQAELAKAGLPDDLMWLAMVESQFTPKIVSRVGASGMWQFMRSTGRRLGLRIDEYVDERFNWEKSTRAATAYLLELYKRFDGEWPLAISAYNMGEGGLERAIAAAGGERDLWKLIEIPSESTRIQLETKKFYPKLIASILVAKDPERFGFTWNPTPPEQTVRVPIKGSYSLTALNNASGFPVGTLKRLNPDLIRGVTPPSGEYSIAVPADGASTVLASLKKLSQIKAETYVARGSGSISHTIKRGETLSTIAEKYHVSQNAIMKANRLKSAHRLIAGRKLTIPGVSTSSSSSAKSDSRSSYSSGQTYTVQKGDTLSEIASKKKVSLADLMKWNKKTKKSRLKIGEKLLLAPLAEIKAASQPTSGEEKIHVVQKGEFPGKIAQMYGVKADDFLKWNNLTANSTIKVGQKLVVRGYREASSKSETETKTAPVSEEQPSVEPTPESAPESGSKVVHVVAKGDCPSIIAEKYGVRTRDLLAWNNLTAKSRINIGDKIVVHTSGTNSPPTTENKPATAEKPVPPTAPETSQDEKITHVVKKGENPTTIAKHHGVKLKDLFEANGWTEAPVLHIGDKVTVIKK